MSNHTRSRTLIHFRNGERLVTISDHPRKGGKRGNLKGWTKASKRSHDRFMLSIDVEKLPPYALIATLTVRNCPPTAAYWAKVLRRFEARMRRRGMVIGSYVVEMQRRRVPHCHCIVMFFDHPPDAEACVDCWLESAGEYGAGRKAQRVESVKSMVAALRYQRTHLHKGLSHWQRHWASYPPGWLAQGKMGKAWGKWGDWKPYLLPETREVLDEGEWFRRRRVMRRQQIATIRSKLLKLDREWGFADWFVGRPCFIVNRWHAKILERRRALRRALWRYRRSFKVPLAGAVDRELAVARVVERSQCLGVTVWTEDWEAAL